MQIKINIPEDKKDAVIDAFATVYKYHEKTEDKDGKEIDNPISKGAFALNVINGFIKEVYVGGKVSAIEDQRKTVVATATAEMEDLTVE